MIDKPLMIVRRALLGLSLMLLPTQSHAASRFLLYQGRYLDNGVPTNGHVSMEFRITDGSAQACGAAANGTSLFWTSASTNVATTNGLFSYKLGFSQDGVSADPAFSSVDFSADRIYYIDVCVAGVSLNPKERIGSNAYSFYASSAGYASTAVSKAGDTMTGDLNMGAKKISNLAAPAAASDAATKGYVDAASGPGAVLVTTGTWSAQQTFLNLISLSTDMYLSAGRINAQGNLLTTAAGKLDGSQLAGQVPQVSLSTAVVLDGSNAMTGDLNMGAKKISNLAAPAAASDAATRGYVDAARPILTTTTYQTGNYTMTGAESVIFIDATAGSLTINLPAAGAGTIGRIFTFIRKDTVSANTVTFDPGANSIIDVGCFFANGGGARLLPTILDESSGVMYCAGAVHIVGYDANTWVLY
ncbi:MAG: hypothetical protein AAB036_00745 [Elusimicrobiota bacterium]